MSLDPPAYILSLQNNIRARPISWDGAVRAKTITDDDLKKIKAIDKVRKEQRKQVIEGDVDTYTQLLLGGGEVKSIFESAAKRPDILQYMLVLAEDLVDDIPPLMKSLISHPEPFKHLLPLLKQSPNPEDPIPLLASALLSTLLGNAIQASSKSTPQIDDALPKVYAYIAQLSKQSDTNLQDIACQEYSVLLRTTKSRSLFWKQRKETLDPLIDVLRTAVGGRDTDSTLANGSGGASSIRSTESNFKIGGSVSLQLLYHILLVIWQLSFEGKLVGRGLDEDHDIVPLYTTLVRLSPKEKTTRLLLGTLQNLLSTNQKTLLPAATAARLPSILQNLKTRHLTDQDLQEDLEKLTTLLDEYTSSRTTLETYTAELDSGHLRWSPPHKNAEFWGANASEIISMENGAYLNKLAAILSKDWASDKQVLAIGCNDVANLVKQCPEKRSQLERAGLKARVMTLMQDENESVRWESLRAVGEWLRYTFDS
ncbi:H(+)-transporting V1 sector ATPase subunit H [Oleoguttula sp. CCFEE 5521]